MLPIEEKDRLHTRYEVSFFSKARFAENSLAMHVRTAYVILSSLLS
jgi:hypothetical protein